MNIIFNPWDPNHSGIIYARYEYGSCKENQFQGKDAKQIAHDFERNKQTVSIFYDGKIKNYIAGAAQNDTIYIRGHGTEHTENKQIQGGAGGEYVDYKTVVQRLKDSGLRSSFNGKIKCFNCHSAESVDDGFPPFAQWMANELWAKGFKSCQVFGYRGGVDSYAQDGPAGQHKYIRETAFNPVSQKYEAVTPTRASAIGNRIEFFHQAGVVKHAKCYIATAACQTLSLPDDCEPLTLLRRFRDSQVLSTESGRRHVSEYYELAPRAIEWIDQQPTAVALYREVYERWICPAVHAIHLADNAKAHAVFREVVEHARRIVLR